MTLRAPWYEQFDHCYACTPGHVCRCGEDFGSCSCGAICGDHGERIA